MKPCLEYVMYLLCQVLMAVLEKALEHQWTESMANAWTELWQVLTHVVSSYCLGDLLIFPCITDHM